MSSVRITKRQVWVDDTAISFLSGALHYWRLVPETWHSCLQRIKEIGLQTIAIYICWASMRPPKDGTVIRLQTEQS